MRPESEYVEVLRLLRQGWNDCAVSRATGVPRCTVRGWRTQPRGKWKARRDGGCPVCGHTRLNRPQYAYLLGLYLGDGCLSLHRRGVYRLRISLDARYPRIVGACSLAMSAVSGRRVGHVRAPGCTVVNAYWKHWPCLFPQHGAGRKHDRRIELKVWQQDVAFEHPGALLRGFIHSDGCRVLNHVNGRDYPRYHFRNQSAEILTLFCRACDDYGVEWTTPRPGLLSVARREDTARLDLVIGPKR
jgi:hypothetical protein